MEKKESVSLRPSIFKRTWIVNPRFQWQFAGLMAVIVGISSVGIYVNLLSFVKTALVDPLNSLPGGTDVAFREAVASQVEQLHLAVAIGIGLGAMVNLLLGIWLSHKIAGPLHRLKREMEEATIQAAPRKLRFRDGDFFLELADSYNGMRERLSNGKDAPEA